MPSEKARITRAFFLFLSILIRFLLFHTVSTGTKKLK